MILKAEPLDPSFKWKVHKPERPLWHGAVLLLAIAAGAGFLVGRLSTAAPVATEQQTPTAGVTQNQSLSQSDTATAIRSGAVSAEAKPAAKDEFKATTTASSTETPKVQSATAADKGSASPPVVIINPSTADKGGDTTRKAAPKAETEAPAKAAAKAEIHKDDVPAATAPKRQAKSQSSAHVNPTAAATRRDDAYVAPVGPRRDDPFVAPRREESFAASRREDSFGASRREDPFVASRRDDAYVPPRAPQAAYGERDQRERFDSVESDDDRARVEQRYPDRRYAEPERRLAEDVPPPRDGYEDRREYLRPFQGARDFRDYRRLDRYDDDVFADRRPVLRPMFGGGPSY